MRRMHFQVWAGVLNWNIDKDSFRYLWYCGKEQIECRLAKILLIWDWFTDFFKFFIQVFSDKDYKP